MKRLIGALLLAFLTAAVTLPAQAYQTRIGGRVSTDLFYALMSGSSYNGGVGARDIRNPDRTAFTAQVSDGSMQFLLYSEDRRTGVHIQINFTAGPAHGAAAVTLTYMYGWYSFGNFRLDVGHKDTMFAAAKYAPYGALGFQQMPSGSGGFFEYGKLYSGRFVQIALYYNRPTWSVMVSLGQGGQNTANLPAWGGAQGGFVMNNLYPRLDVAFEYRHKYFSVGPGFMVYLTNWNHMEGINLQDDRSLTFALAFPFRFQYGNFGFTGEVSYGRNVIVPSMFNTYKGGLWWGGGNDGNNRLKVAPTELYGACLGFFYQIGPVTLWLSGGWEMTVNGSSDANGTWRHGQNNRYAVVFAAPYQVNRHLTIAPEIGYYFFGWDPTQDVGGPNNPSTTADLGSAWLMGVRISFSF